MRRLLSSTAVGSVLLALGCAGSARAQAEPQADAGVVQEVVVTAQRRAQNLQDVGISVTAVPGQEIERQGIATSAQLAAGIPSVDTFSPFGPGANANVVIRGIGLNDFGDGNEAPVTTYVDEFYIVSVPATDFGLFDLEGAEVLRGPQGTLFGRNATGGLVSYRTARPGVSSGGYVRAEYGRFDARRFEAAADLPLGAQWTARISALSHHRDGYQTNRNASWDRGFSTGTDAVRGQLRFRDPDGWDILLKAEYGETRSNQGYYEPVPGFVDPATGFLFKAPDAADAAGYNELRTPVADRNRAHTDAPSWLHAKSGSALLRLERTFGDVVFTSLSGYQNAKRTLFEDSDGTPNGIISSIFPHQGEWGTQEFRLFRDAGPLKLTAGVYGLYAVLEDQPDSVFNIPVSAPPPVAPGSGLYVGDYFPLSLHADWRQVTKSASVFAQGEYEVTPRLTLIVGGRVTHDRKSFRDVDNASLRSCPGGDGAPDAAGIGRNCFLVADGGSGIANPFRLRYDETLVSGKIELDYRLDERTLLYASASRGTKSGGFNNGYYAAGLSADRIPYRAETLYAFEVGEKTQLLDRRLQINANAFYYDYRNYQTFNYEGVGGFLTNQDANAYGGEIEVTAAPSRSLSLRLGASYLRTEIEGVAQSLPAGGVFVADREMAFAPRWTVTGGLTYTTEPVVGHELVAAIDVSARGARFTDNFNNPGTRLGGFVRVNATLDYQLSDSVEVQLYARNIGNRQDAIYSGNSFAGIGLIQFKYAEPRTFGGAIRYSW